MIYWPSEEECGSIATELRNSHNFPCVEGLIYRWDTHQGVEAKRT